MSEVERELNWLRSRVARAAMTTDTRYPCRSCGADTGQPCHEECILFRVASWSDVDIRLPPRISIQTEEITDER